MRVIADEMISPKIVRAVSDTVLRANWRFESVHNANLRGQADEDWVMAFARSSGHAIISADQKMLKRPTLIRRIAETGLIGIYLPSVWAGQRRDEQLAYIVYWWRKIEEKIEAASVGTAWVVPRGMARGEIHEHKVMREASVRRKRSPRGIP